MPSLTVTEKEHWKNRIALRIDKQIDVIAARDANFLGQIERDARRRALESLGLAAWHDELNTIERQREALERREKVLQRTMLAHVRQVPLEDIDTCHSYQLHDEVNRAIDRRKVIHEGELLRESDLGREILRLRREKENLLDTVWLASSTTQLKTLWQNVATLLGDEATQLERAALAIPAVTDA